MPAWVDKLAARFGYRKASTAQRGFAAGNNTRLTSTWGTSNASANAELFRSLDVMRARSRDLCNNNDYAKHFLRMVERNVIGPAGIGLQARVYMDIDPKSPDKLANDAIESAWARWGKRGVCEVTGRLSFRALTKLAIKTVARDGEFLARKIRGRNEFGYALQLLDIDRLDTRLVRARDKSFGEIKMGVEVDEFGRATHYWLRPYHPGEMFMVSTAEINAQHIRVPANEIIHLFVSERPEQVRGIPWMHAAMIRLNNLGAYEEAAIIAARVGASQMGFFTWKDGYAPADNDSGAGGAATGVDADGVPYTEVEPGQFGDLSPGRDFVKFDPDYPHAMYADFTKACLRGIASGLGVAYHALANDLNGVNFSSIRSGTLEERDGWMTVQEWFIDDFQEPVYEDWLPSALAFGMVKMPNGSTLPVRKLDQFSAHLWQPRRWQWVDPLKDIEAMVKAIENGLSSPQEACAQQGKDLEEVLQDIKAAQELAATLGVRLGPVQGEAETSPQDDTEDTQEQATQATAKALVPLVEQLRELRLAVEVARASTPQPIHVAGPTVNVAPAEVRNEISTPPPVVNVEPANIRNEVNVPAPVVHVAAPEVRVEAPKVDVTVEAVMPDRMEMAITEMPTRETTTTIERNSAGEIKTSKQVEKDA